MLYFLFVLKLPKFTKAFNIKPNSSDVAVGAVFLQQYNDGLHLMVYFRKKYFPAERDYAPSQ